MNLEVITSTSFLTIVYRLWLHSQTKHFIYWDQKLSV